MSPAAVASLKAAAALAEALAQDAAANALYPGDLERRLGEIRFHLNRAEAKANICA